MLLYTDIIQVSGIMNQVHDMHNSRLSSSPFIGRVYSLFGRYYGSVNGLPIMDIIIES